MKKLLICLFALFSLVVLIVGPVNANNIDPSDFMDNAEKYKGKQITFIPENLTDVPKAVFPDRVEVTFVCKDGDPKHGNVAVSIKLSP